VQLESLRREPLSQQVKERLKLYFVANGLTTGDPIPTEHELASKLNVSRAALREALKSLESLGIIEVRPGMGRFLATFNVNAILDNLAYGIECNVRDFGDILEVRIALEETFLTRYVSRFTAERIRELRDIIDAMRRLIDKGGSEDEVIQVHTDFHLALYREPGNWLLLSLIKTFATVQRSLTLLRRYQTQDMTKFIDQHAALVDAIEAGDPEAVRDRLLEHFEEALAWSETESRKSLADTGSRSNHFREETKR
jgi:DNA-binding FadR family transcriptional regulator